MKIALFAPFEESVPPKKYGGTELIVYNLVSQFVNLGYEVTLIGAGDSRVPAQLFSVFNTSIRKMPDANDMKIRDAYKYIGIGKAVSFLVKQKFDILHNHLGWRLLSFQDIFKYPVVTTLHGPLDIAYQQKVYGQYAQANFISISMNQRRPMPHLNYVANVYNGIDLDIFEMGLKPKDYFAFLGRMSPEKGPLEAILAAKKAKIQLLMAAKIDAVDEAYYQAKIRPLIDGKQIRFLGELTHKQKNGLLKHAKGLLALIQWEEPFGLFFIEAMACGTPVITMDRGSVRELVRDKQTGFICGTQSEVVKAIKNIGRLERRACRDHVEKNFSASKMAKEYLAAYRLVIKRSSSGFLC